MISFLVKTENWSIFSSIAQQYSTNSNIYDDFIPLYHVCVRFTFRTRNDFPFSASSNFVLRIAKNQISDFFSTELLITIRAIFLCFFAVIKNRREKSKHTQCWMLPSVTHSIKMSAWTLKRKNQLHSSWSLKKQQQQTYPLPFHLSFSFTLFSAFAFTSRDFFVRSTFIPFLCVFSLSSFLSFFSKPSHNAT